MISWPVYVVLMDFFLFQVVGESGLFTPDDVAYVQNAGVSAVSLLITRFQLSWSYMCFKFPAEILYGTSEMD